jgi:hypothetical protein
MFYATEADYDCSASPQRSVCVEVMKNTERRSTSSRESAAGSQRLNVTGGFGGRM